MFAKILIFTILSTATLIEGGLTSSFNLTTSLRDIFNFTGFEHNTLFDFIKNITEQRGFVRTSHKKLRDGYLWESDELYDDDEIGNLSITTPEALLEYGNNENSSRVVRFISLLPPLRAHFHNISELNHTEEK